MRNKKEPNSSVFLRFLEKLLDVISREVTTLIGRVNLISDALLALIALFLFAANKYVQIAIAISSIWYNDLAKYLSDKTSFIAFCICLGFITLCLIFIGINDFLQNRKSDKPE